MSRPCFKALTFEDGSTVLNIHVTNNGHLECMLTSTWDSMDDDADNLRKLKEWLRRNTNYVVAMNRDCSECPGCGIDCFTMAYQELGKQLDALKEGVEEVVGWSGEPRVVATFVHEEQSYPLCSQFVYGYDLDSTWSFYGHSVTMQHVLAMTSLAVVREANLVQIPDFLSNALDVTLYPTDDLLSTLQQVVYGLASAKL